MKKLSVALYVVLFIAVGALFVLHFTGKKNGKPVSTSANNGDPGRGIVYVNIDSVIFNFDMFSDLRENLSAKQKNAEAELNSKGSQYEKGVRDYQDKVNKGLVTRATAGQMEQALLQQQQDLIALREKLQTDLVEEEQVMNRQIIDYITKYLDENKSEYNYQFILGRSFGGAILYSNNNLDITDRVLEALNRKYQSEKK